MAQTLKASARNVGNPGSIPGSGRSPGEGNGNPLQYSCLENSMDGVAWQATVHGVAKSQNQWSDFTHSEVKQTEKRDSVLMSKNQIERLTLPGSSYFNLNPFEVLQIDPKVTDEDIKKRFQQLSILVHPDKNQDDADRAQKAFEAVDKAYKLPLDWEQKKRALDVIQAGKEDVEHTIKERKKQLKKEGKPTNVGRMTLSCSNKQYTNRPCNSLLSLPFLKRKERQAKEMHGRKQQREEETEAQAKAK